MVLSRGELPATDGACSHGSVNSLWSLQLSELLQKPEVNGGFCPENSWRRAGNRRKSVGISEPCDWSADQKANRQTIADDGGTGAADSDFILITGIRQHGFDCRLEKVHV